MVLNVVGSNPIGHPSSNPLQLCVVRDFLSIYLLPPLSAFRPPAQPQCDKSPVAVHSRRAPFLVPCPCCRRGVRRTVCTPPESAARLLARSHTCPNARGCRKRFAPLHRRMRSGANRLLGWGNDAPAPMRFSKDCRDLSKRTFPRARERVRTPHFSFFAFTLHLLV